MHRGSPKSDCVLINPFRSARTKQQLNHLFIISKDISHHLCLPRVIRCLQLWYAADIFNLDAFAHILSSDEAPLLHVKLLECVVEGVEKFPVHALASTLSNTRSPCASARAPSSSPRDVTPLYSALCTAHATLASYDTHPPKAPHLSHSMHEACSRRGVLTSSAHAPPCPHLLIVASPTPTRARRSCMQWACPRQRLDGHPHPSRTRVVQTPTRR